MILKKNNIILYMEQSQKYDPTEISQAFIEYFYKTWINNPQDLLQTVISHRSKLKYNHVVYEYTDIIIILNQMKLNGLEISVLNYEVIDSKSRQIYILLRGIIKSAYSTSTFSQTFVLTLMNKKNNQWNLINSILIIE